MYIHIHHDVYTSYTWETLNSQAVSPMPLRWPWHQAVTAQIICLHCQVQIFISSSMEEQESLSLSPILLSLSINQRLTTALHDYFQGYALEFITHRNQSNGGGGKHVLRSHPDIELAYSLTGSHSDSGGGNAAMSHQKTLVT